MLRKEDFAVIEALSRRGVYQKDIAAQLGVHPKTVSRALKRGAAPTRPCARRASKLDPYKAQVDALLAEEVWNAVVIFRELQAAGYPGGISILRDYIRPKRALRAGRQTVRFETAPGQQLQSDWGQVRTHLGGEVVTVHFAVNTLGYSRRFHLFCAPCEDAEHTYEGLVRSFEHFGGVPQEVLVDNMKSAVYAARGARPARFQARFVDLAAYYGFTPRACRPYRARTKGKTERMVGYVKGHFFQRYRAFEDWTHLQQQAEAWLTEEADPRCHGTTQEVVATRFAREAAQLGQLPARRYDTSYRETRRVGWDGYIEVRGNRYSVPAALAGETVTVRIGLDHTLRVVVDEQVVARHLLQPRAAGWQQRPEHHAELWAALQVEQRSLATYEAVSQWS